MKTIRITLVCLCLFALLTQCKEDGPGEPPKTEAELRAEIMAGGTWTPASSSPVTVNGLAVPELFTDFTITFTNTGTGGNYTTTGTTPVWPRSGTWTFAGEDGLIFKREDNLEITIVEITETGLKLSLEWPETTYGERSGRSKSLVGTTVFTLSK